MAWIFSAWVQCGTGEQARAIVNHFDRASLDTTDGTVVTCKTSICARTCCWIAPTNVSRTGVTSAQVAEHLSMVGYWLYSELRAAPAFRFALVGVEVDDVRSNDEIVAMVQDSHPACRGLIVAEEYWKRAGCPSRLEPFSPGLVWWPYAGEEYPTR